MGGRGGASGKSSGGARVALIPGKNDPELTDAIEDFSLPQSVRDRLPEIQQIRSYDDLKSYLAEKSIELDTDLDILKGAKSSTNIDAVAETAQKLVVGIETFEAVYGKDSLKSLKRVKLYDNSLDVTAAFHYNQIGENDPLAGTMRFSNWNASGHVVFHELTHAYQASKARKGEDALKYSDRIMSGFRGKIDVSYTGSTSSVKNAETMAEMVSWGFVRGNRSPDKVKFINYSRGRK